MKKNIVISVIIGVLLLCLIFFTYLSIPKIRYVDNSLILTKTKISINAKALLNKEIETYNEELKKKNNILKELQILLEYNKNDKDIKEKFGIAYEDYNGYLNVVNSEYLKKEQEIMKPIYLKINELINDYGKLKGYDIILGANNEGNIVYGKKKYDVTQMVIEYINKN